MKKFIFICLCIGFLFMSSSMVNASDQLLIIYNDGTSQAVNLKKSVHSIKSINFQGGNMASAQGAITVVAGTYGKNCGAPHGNKTEHLAGACNSRTQCEYVINYQVIGDPAVGCGKDYVAEWRCGGDTTIHQASAAPEAGFNKKILLTCQ
ncbi:MAG: hypothetical protein CSYNP_02553 [Syntrophus sp. SKADARSKE-3]|nr:hypothetical protein [Syntrophus sp. SKADARSKE-3]